LKFDSSPGVTKSSDHATSPVGQLACGGVMLNVVLHEPDVGDMVNVGLLSADAVPVTASPPATTAAVTAAVRRMRFLAFIYSGLPLGACSDGDWVQMAVMVMVLL
jgi:hypothetical protein